MYREVLVTDQHTKSNLTLSDRVLNSIFWVKSELESSAHLRAAAPRADGRRRGVVALDAAAAGALH